MTSRLPQLVEVDSDGVTATVTAPLVHQCPFKDETDHGTVTLSWRVAGQTLELHSLRDWLGTFTPLLISHEDLTTRLWYTLRHRLHLEGVRVTTEWETAGMRVSVQA